MTICDEVKLGDFVVDYGFVIKMTEKAIGIEVNSDRYPNGVYVPHSKGGYISSIKWVPRSIAEFIYAGKGRSELDTCDVNKWLLSLPHWVNR